MTSAIPKDDTPEHEDEAPRRNWWLLLILLPIVVAIVLALCPSERFPFSIGFPNMM